MMKTFHFKTEYSVFKDTSELSDENYNLLKLAKEQSRQKRRVGGSSDARKGRTGGTNFLHTNLFI